MLHATALPARAHCLQGPGSGLKHGPLNSKLPRKPILACALQRAWSACKARAQQVLYLDIDTLWLGEPGRAWTEFEDMASAGVLFGMAEETSAMNAEGSWYRGGECFELGALSRWTAASAMAASGRWTLAWCRALKSFVVPCTGFSKGLPYFGERGLNAGVLLLSLRRLRASQFSRERTGLLGIFCPGKRCPWVIRMCSMCTCTSIRNMSTSCRCTFNFRSDSACYDGFPVILHGNRGLRNDANSTYSTLYKLFGIVAASLQ